MRLLTVEDNPRVADLLAEGLVEQGYQVDIARTGHDAEDFVNAHAYDLIILDLMLPDLDGVQLCRNFRRLGITTPILMLTALAAVADKVAGLEAGADDYLTKPFDLDELVARVRALLRRSTAVEGAVLQYDDVVMDLTKRRVSRAGSPVNLTSREFSLLEHFLRNPNRVLTRMNLAERVWDMNFEEDSNVIEVYVSRLRSKIDKDFDRQLIHTIIGTGYVLAAEKPPA